MKDFIKAVKHTRIYVTKKNVYGSLTIYPYCECAKLFCEITGRKTFTQSDISKIQKLGYEFCIHTDKEVLL